MIIEDYGIILAMRRFGESAYIATCFLRENGLQSGIIRRARNSRRTGDSLSAGNIVYARWHARLAEHLGQYSMEVHYNVVAHIHQYRLGLYTLNAALSWLNIMLLTGDPAPELFARTIALLGTMDNKQTSLAILQTYVWFEVQLLQHMGQPLDLSRCAATGGSSNLAFVSPKSGRAVSIDSGTPYGDRLLLLPNFMAPEGGDCTIEDVKTGLKITTFFLERRLSEHYGKHMPQARQRLLNAIDTGV